MGKNKVRKHTLSEKFVSNSIDKNWTYRDDIQKFSHPIYPNRLFTPLCSNKIVEKKYKMKDKYGKFYIKKERKMISEMFPYVPPDEDNRNLGYTIGTDNSSIYFDVVPNKMKSFWDTRRGKRYISYISYRKTRDANKKLWLKTQKEN